VAINQPPSVAFVGGENMMAKIGRIGKCSKDALASGVKN
jgi:hypothetical protein